MQFLCGLHDPGIKTQPNKARASALEAICTFEVFWG